MIICEFSIQNQNIFTIINRFKFEYSRNEMQNNVNTKFGADENCVFFRFWRIPKRLVRRAKIRKF